MRGQCRRGLGVGQVGRLGDDLRPEGAGRLGHRLQIIGTEIGQQQAGLGAGVLRQAQGNRAADAACRAGDEGSQQWGLLGPVAIMPAGRQVSKTRTLRHNQHHIHE